jgi:hypothetical protein
MTKLESYLDDTRAERLRTYEDFDRFHREWAASQMD